MEKVKLGDVCERATSNYAQKDLEELDGKYPVYGAGGFIKNIDTYHQEKEYVAVVKDGAGIGRTMFLPARSSVIGTLQYLLPKGGIEPRYLYFAVKSMHLEKYYTGATIPHIYFKDYRNEMLYLPSKEKQREIIKIFVHLESMINDRKEQLLLLDTLIKSRFVEMFGNLKSNSKGWDIKTFDELAYFITDGEHATPRRVPEGIYLLSARNVLNHSIQLDDVDYIDQEEYDRIAKRVIPQEGDVLISCSGTVGRCCSVPVGMKFQMVRSVALLRFKEDINPVFAEYMITSDYLQEQINSSKTVSSQANLFQGKIKALKGFVPPKGLQDEFLNFVHHVDKSKLQIQKSLDETQLLFDSLMQKYFG